MFSWTRLISYLYKMISPRRKTRYRKYAYQNKNFQTQKSLNHDSLGVSASNG
jgi:hypothetical protein